MKSSRRVPSAGGLSNLITFRRKTVTNVSGSIKEDWVDDFDEWAAYEPVGTREFPAAEKRNSETKCRFRIRYRAGIDTDLNQIVFTLEPDASPSQAHIFNIFPPVDPTGERFELVIEAVEVK